MQGMPDALNELGLGHVDRFAKEFREVMGFEAGLVEKRVLLREDEGLVEVSLAVQVAEVRPGKQPIEAFTGEDKPAAVARPAMPGFGLLAV